MVIIFLADGFELVEALTPLDMLKRAGSDVKTVSINDSLEVRSSCSVTVKADMTINDLENEDIEMIVLPGGMPGAENLRNNKTVCSLVKGAFERNLPIGAICAAPYILGELGLLENKKVTCFPGFEQYLHGAVLSKNNTVSDGNIITAAGMGAALPFSYELVSSLKGKETADKIMKTIMA